MTIFNKMRRLILIIAAFIMVMGCHRPKEVGKTSQSDSLVVRYETRYVQKDSLVVTNKVNYTNLLTSPCDSLGILKPFNQSFRSGPVKVLYRSVGSNIELQIDVDSIISSYKTIIDSKDSIIQHLRSKSELKTVIRTEKATYPVGLIILVLLVVIGSTIYTTKKYL